MGISFIVWEIAGILMLAISFFVHSHTYEWKGVNKVTIPRWAAILVVLIAFIPLINLIAFVVGIIAYIVSIQTWEITFKIKPCWLRTAIEWLMYRV